MDNLCRLLLSLAWSFSGSLASNVLFYRSYHNLVFLLICFTKLQAFGLIHHVKKGPDNVKMAYVPPFLSGDGKS